MALAIGSLTRLASLTRLSRLPRLRSLPGRHSSQHVLRAVDLEGAQVGLHLFLGVWVDLAHLLSLAGVDFVVGMGFYEGLGRHVEGRLAGLAVNQVVAGFGDCLLVILNLNRHQLGV